MPAQTPTGSRKEKRSTPRETWAEKSPLSSCGMPHANSTTSSPRCTSPAASESTLPCSSVMASASRSTLALTSSRKAKSTLVRVLSDDCDHSTNASRAAPTAASTSEASASATSACCSPVAGFQTGERRSPDPLVLLPAIQCSIVLMTGSPRCAGRTGAGGSVAAACSARTSCAPRWVLSSAEVSATGTSHQAGLSGAGTVGSVSTWITVVTSAAWASAYAFSSSVDARDPDDVGAEAGGVRGEVDRQHVAVEAALGAVAVAGAEALRAQRLRQRPDGGEAVVLDQHHDQLHALLDGGDDLLRHHQVGAVADHDHDVAVLAGVEGGHLDAQAAGDLVAHAGEAVLHVVALAVAGAPQLVEVAGHRAGGADHDVLRPAEAVDRRRAPRTAPAAGAWPRSCERCTVASHSRASAVARSVWSLGRRPAGQRVGELLEPAAGVALSDHGRQLVGVDRGDVEVDEAHAGVGEDGLGGGGEVAVAGADADDDVRLGGQGVGGRGAGGADGADGLRVVEGQRALAGLGLRDRDAGGLDEGAQRVGGVGVDHAAAGDQQRALARSGPPRPRGPGRRPRPAAGRRARPGGRRGRPRSPTPRPARPGAARASPRRSRPGR